MNCPSCGHRLMTIRTRDDDGLEPEVCPRCGGAPDGPVVLARSRITKDAERAMGALEVANERRLRELEDELRIK